MVRNRYSVLGAGDSSFAGNKFALEPGDPWWDQVECEDWPDGVWEKHLSKIWNPTYGDRRQEMVVIGQRLNVPAIRKALDDALVPEETMTADDVQEESDKLVWASGGDPFGERWQEEGLVSYYSAANPWESATVQVVDSRSRKPRV